MKRIEHFFRLKTIRSRIITMQLVIIIPALILLGVVLYQQMGNLLIKTNSESYDKVLESTGRILDNNLEYYRDIARNVLSDDVLQNVLKSYKSDSSDAEMMDSVSQIKLKDAMTQYMFGFSGLRAIHIFDNAGRRFTMEYGNVSNSSFKDFKISDMEKTVWYQQMLEGQGYETFIGFDVIKEKEDAFSCVKVLKSLDTQEKIGILVLTFDKSVFKNALPSNEEDSGKYLLVDTKEGKSHIVAFSSGTEEEAQKSLDIINAQDEDYYTSAYKDSETGWKLLYTIRQQDIVKEAAGIIRETAGALLGIYR